ncbi:MAG TPA: carbohydrate-binding family 9-like protein, partial [Chthoniobacteraceae bacterium]
MSSENSLPTIRCERGIFGDIAAGPGFIPWSGIQPVQLLETVTGALPEQATRLRVGWSESELRLLFECDDREPWATLTARDAPLYTEEVVEVFRDPVGDLESYFEIEVNPLNAVCDLVLRRNRSGYAKNFAWNCEGLQTAVRRTTTGWNAELAIPFSEVAGEAPISGTRWRANFFRIDRPPGRERELSSWS